MKGESITMSKKQQKLNLDNASGGLWVGGDRAQPAWGGKEPLCSGVGVCGYKGGFEGPFSNNNPPVKVKKVNPITIL